MEIVLIYLSTQEKKENSWERSFFFAQSKKREHETEKVENGNEKNEKQSMLQPMQDRTRPNKRTINRQ
jgi:hypothetical protein